ncbi:MAG: hypothetical protein ACC669_05555 [bacterium]
MEKKAKSKDNQPCPECQGSGLTAMGCNLFPCHACSGSGKVNPDKETETQIDPVTSREKAPSDDR